METKSHEWIEQTEARIREAFDLFDKDKADAIIQEEVSVFLLLRSPKVINLLSM